jgi:hypothetical protein
MVPTRATTASVRTTSLFMNRLLICGWLLVLPRTRCPSLPNAGHATTVPRLQTVAPTPGSAG